MSILLELISGILTGIIFGGIASIAILALSLVFRYFTGEKFPIFMGIVLGLGFLGIGGGLLAVLEQPTFEGVIEIIVASVVIVWSLNVGDKLAEKIPKRSDFFSMLRAKKSRYMTIKLPRANLIHDISGMPRIPDHLKIELSDREFLMPSDLPMEELSNRLKRRLATDWGIGEMEFELDEEGHVTYIAIAAKEHGISETLPDESVAIPIKCGRIPIGLAAGDFVRIYLEDNQVVDGVEVKGIDMKEKIVTVVTSSESLEKIREMEASLIVALPSLMRRSIPIEVMKRSGTMEEFDEEKIASSVKMAGTSVEIAAETAEKVKEKVAKTARPVSTEKIREAIEEELKDKDSKAAESYKKKIRSPSV